MARRLDVFLMWCAILILIYSNAAAEYNSERLGEAIGGYLIANDMFERLANSKCGYVVRKEYSLSSAIRETMPYLNDRDRRELLLFTESQGFNDDLTENQVFIDEFMQAGAKDRLDEKTICGIVSSIVAMTYQKSETNWEFARDRYSK